METLAVTLHLLGVVHRPVAGRALVASAPVRHGLCSVLKETRERERETDDDL